VLEELRRLVPKDDRYGPILYDLVFDYPLRDAKALRPALAIATCRALGGTLEGISTSAAVLELYHNAFLVHDDVEDGSELRRDAPTLHRKHGVPVAMNVGDAMLALALEPLLDNMRVLTLGKALRILQVVARMARETAEGQALELAWIRDGNWSLTDRDYMRMVHKKTSFYTFLAPVTVGAIVGGAEPKCVARLRLFATALGVAFQIRDDVLNLSGSERAVGKEIEGDLWEGKHTLILIHALRSSSARDRTRAIAILNKPRPVDRSSQKPPFTRELVLRLADEGRISQSVRRELEAAIDVDARADAYKTVEDVAFLMKLVRRHRSIDYAGAIAARWAARARKSLGEMTFLGPSVHRNVLFELSDFVVGRNH
jgi:geranylgeranyl diphosphate synthase type II